jgi:hypothetical protein
MRFDQYGSERMFRFSQAPCNIISGIPMTKIDARGTENRNCLTISQALYEKVQEFIILAIKNHPEECIQFCELLDEAEGKILTNRILPWHVMQVKNDLNERGIIKTSIGNNRKQIISIVQKNRKKRLSIL